MIHAPKAETMIPILKWYFKERADSELSANYPKKTVIGLADAIMQESAMDIWSIGHILTINVNEQLSGGRDDT